ncbi:MAG: hypothetical protein Q4C42_04300 [Clostridia bacterium]|nr:hypothetical protein [Clostridia bacterium]
MAIKQISVYVENKMGKLHDMVKEVSDADINIRASMIADTAEFGIFRMIVSDTDKALRILSEKSMVNITKVVAVKMEDKTGSLTKVLSILKDAAISVEYMYAFAGAAELGAYVVLRVNNAEAAEKLLNANGISTLNDEDIAL